MIKRWLIAGLALSLAVLSGGCGEGGVSVGECKRYCDKMKLCDQTGAFTEGKYQSCHSTCEESQKDNSEISLNDNLIACADNEDCEAFLNCVSATGTDINLTGADSDAPER